MPRDGSGILSLPNPPFVPDETISSTQVNGNFADLVNDGNAARPITAGGTGATNAADALAALGGISSVSPVFTDDTFRIADNADATKKVAFEIAGVATATTRVIAIPDKSGTMALTADYMATASYPTLVSLEGLTLVAGDLLYATGGDTLAKLTKGTDGQLLTMASGAVSWAAAPAGGQPIPTSGTYDVGTMVCLYNNSGSSVANGSTTAGSGLRTFTLVKTTVNAGGTIFDTTNCTVVSALTGTWKNVNGGAVASGATGNFVRTV